MTAATDWAQVSGRANRLRHTSAFIVEKAGRTAAMTSAIGIPKRLELTDDLARELGKRTKDRLGDQANLIVTQYDPGSRPESGEIVSLPISQVDGLSELRNDLLGDGPQSFDGHDESSSKRLLYGVVLGRGTEALVCIQQFFARHELRKDQWLFAIDRSGTYGTLKETGFAFDLNFDLFLTEEYVYALSNPALERLTGYLDQVRELAHSHAVQISQRIPIANPEEFFAACVNDMRFGRKAMGIVSRAAFAHVTPEKLRAHATHHGVELSEDAEGRFIFSNVASERWRLLKLLDDDFLDSRLTEERYEVNSKRAL